MPQRPEANAIALDLGTTTLGGLLLGPAGDVLASAQEPNPQAPVAADVIGRLEAARAGGAERLQGLLRQGIASLVRRLLEEADCRPAGETRIAAAGNPAITHLLLRLPVESLLFPPHRPPQTGGRALSPGDLGIDLPGSAYLFPLVSGFVGGDLVAFLYGRQPGPHATLYVDIGTNGEIALWTDGGWWATSVAAGPAFEAGNISCGMPYRRGAVEGLVREGDSWRLRTVGDGAPEGICGRGLIEVVAAALRDGLLDRRGTLAAPEDVPDNLARYLVPSGSGRALRLYRDAAREVLLTQEDVRRFQLAKGAVRAGIDSLLKRAGVDPGEVGEVVLSGAFGFSLAPESLKKVALLPEIMVDKVRFEPDGVLAGLGRWLRDPDGQERAENLARSLRPYPLSGTPAFEEAFLRALDF